jgi:hypothetical protein
MAAHGPARLLALADHLSFPTTQSGATARKYLGTRRTQNRKRVRVDGRTRCAQQIKYKLALYSKQLGGIKDPLMKLRLLELVELEVLTSEMRARGLKGEVGSFDLFQLNRFTNTIARLRAGLGLAAEPSVWSTLAMLDAAE